MAGLDTRTGKRNAEPPPRRAENIKQVKQVPAKIPTKTAVQVARRVETTNSMPIPGMNSGVTSSTTGNPSNQLNFNDQQALMMNRARASAQQDYDRDLGTAQMFGQQARAREVNNQASSFEEKQILQNAADNQAVRTASNLASSNQVSQRQAEVAAAQLSAFSNAQQANAQITVASEQQTQESQRQSSINAAQLKQAQTQGMFSLLGSLNNSFSQGGYKYW